MCSSALRCNNHDSDSKKKGILFSYDNTIATHFWASPLTFSGKTTYTPWLSLFAFALRTTQASQLFSQFSQAVQHIWIWLKAVMLYKPQKKKTNSAFKKGHPSFLIYLSLHLNMSLFALCTCCLHTHKKSSKTEILKNFGWRAGHRDSAITLALRNSFSKCLCCVDVYISSSQWGEKKHWETTYCWHRDTSHNTRLPKKPDKNTSFEWHAT